MRGDSLKERILRVATIEEVVAAYVPLQRSAAVRDMSACVLSMQTSILRCTSIRENSFSNVSLAAKAETCSLSCRRSRDVRLRKRWENWRNGIRLTVGSGQ